jgi:SAM-dependent methyltransferase
MTTDAATAATTPAGALDAYEALAPAYDLLAAEYPHDRWLATIASLAREAGVSGRRALDVACGTGRSFVPLLDRGWDVAACDVSPAMVARARLAAAGRADVFVADMRRLDAIGEFDLITCLDDALNYVVEPDDVVAALEGFARNLAPDGLAVWDVNTLATLRRGFSSDWIRDGGDVVVTWHGRSSDDVPAGGVFEAAVDVYTAAGDGWSRSRGIHTQRHWPVATLGDLAGQAGLEVVRTLGQRSGVRLEPFAGEARHDKVLLLARRR